ncbi:MAG: PQQ-dependent sugar dehydrogenase [Flavobacteriales bacterium]|nr:PQQ-dependent sugar dehydrogenase [Flavobacteriales bacterium]
MIRKTTLALATFFIGIISATSQPSTVTVGNTTLDVRVVIEGTNSSNGIDIPWEIQWGPDNFIWMTERYGRVSRLDPETGVRTTILDLTNAVYDQSEAGLLGLQLHPDFANNPYVYIAYTYSSGGVKERIVRYTYNESTNSLGSPFILLDNINGNSTHNGCRLLMLPDGTMLATTGDYQNQSSPQNVNHLNGKILRMNLDGSAPSDNPFGPTNYTYTMGNRNAQGLTLSPNGKIYSSEHGPSTNDEFNIIVAGGNYGWPDVEGYCNESGEIVDCNNMTDYQDPLTIWYENSTIAPSDLIWYNHPAIPEWQGKMLMTVLKNKHLKEIEVDGTNGTTVVSETIWFQNTFDRLRDILATPDGRVFLATSGTQWANTNPFSHSIIELKNSAYSPVGVEDQVVKLRTGIYPNPSNGNLEFTFSQHLLNGTITILDVAGKTLYTDVITGNKMKLDLSVLASGLYIASAIKGNYTSTERLIISE